MRSGCWILTTLYQCSLSSRDVVISSVGLIGHLMLLLSVELPLLGRYRPRVLASRLAFLLVEFFPLLLVCHGLLGKDFLLPSLELTL